MRKSVVNEPKTSTFQIRVNPEYKEELERLYADCGMTLTQAVNVFFQMSLKVGGLPFIVNRDPRTVIGDPAVGGMPEADRKEIPFDSEGRRDYLLRDEGGERVASWTGRNGT